MKHNKASRTAQYMALFRALESRRPMGERLFDDPYAIAFLDSAYKSVTRISSISFFREIIHKIIQHKIPGALSSGIARTKYIDDVLKKRFQERKQQVIILGAGFDTRSLRLDFLKAAPVIEIDHPNTSRLKQDCLVEVLGELPANTRYLQLDFNEQSLEGLAAQENIDYATPATIIWEGVTNYLTAEAIDKTFGFIEKFARGSSVIFTYVDNLVLEKPQLFFGAEKLLKDLAEIEERWTFGFYPDTLADYLNRFKLTLMEDLGAATYRDKYWPGRDAKGYEFYRVAYAVRE